MSEGVRIVSEDKDGVQPADTLRNEIVGILLQLNEILERGFRISDDIRMQITRIASAQKSAESYRLELSESAGRLRRHEEVLEALVNQVARVAELDPPSDEDARAHMELDELAADIESRLILMKRQAELTEQLSTNAERRLKRYQTNLDRLISERQTTADDFAIFLVAARNSISALAEANPAEAALFASQINEKITAYDAMNNFPSLVEARHTLERMASRPDQRSAHVNDLISRMRVRRGTVDIRLRDAAVNASDPSSPFPGVLSAWSASAATSTDLDRLLHDQKEIAHDFRDAVLRILAEEHPGAFLRAASAVLESGRHLELDEVTRRVLAEAIRRAAPEPSHGDPDGASGAQQDNAQGRPTRPRLRSLNPPQGEEAS
jgi:hypothetical protein